MNFGILQYFLAAKDTDFSEIIFIIVIAVFWILGAIVKVISRSSQKGEKSVTEKDYAKHQLPSQTSQYKRQPPSQPDQYKAIPKARRPSTRPEVALKRPVQKIKRPVKTEPMGVKVDLPEIPVLPDEFFVEGTAKPIYEEKRKVKKVEKETEPKTEELLLSFDNIDDIRKGILYYEILGKPLSLREQERLF